MTQDLEREEMGVPICGECRLGTAQELATSK